MRMTVQNLIDDLQALPDKHAEVTVTLLQKVGPEGGKWPSQKFVCDLQVSRIDNLARKTVIVVEEGF